MRKLGWVIALAFAAAGGAGCGEPFTTTGSAAGATSSTSTGMGGSQATSATASTSVGTGGQGGSGVTTSSTSSSSSSGAPACTPTSCAMGSYCDSTSGACADCTDFTHFHFGKPFPLTVPLPGVGTGSFPRLAPDGTMYLADTEAGGTVLATAAYQAFPIWSKAMYLPSPPNPSSIQGADYLGPLYLQDGTVLQNIDGSVPSGALLLYDAFAAGPTGTSVRKIFAYSVNSGAPSVQITLPGTADTTGESRIAVAPGAQRIWWLSASSGQSGGLLTAKPGDKTPASVAVSLDDGNDAFPNQPWVTLDGKILLLSTVYAAPSKDLVAHLFYTQLDPQSGLPKGNATRIYPMDAAEADGAPALVSNACALVFTRDGALSGALRD